MLRVGLIAGEPSGDQLGEGLMRAIRERAPDAVFEGVGGPRMEAEGCRVLFPMERLSVIGLVEVLGRYRELHAMRAQLVRHFTAEPPDVFVGIDAPDFNLGLEERLKSVGIRTVHYVSPTVWAWRRGRMRDIARAADLILTLFPFEAPLYEEQGMAVRYVGHPLADAIPPTTPTGPARAALGLAREDELVALLPGSREGEVRSLAGIFIRTALWCLERRPGLRFVVPLVHHGIRRLFEQTLDAYPDLPITLFDGQAREVMAASDAVLLASGTATLEAMLLKRPMVVAYRLSPITYWLARRLLYVDRYAMPNLLAGESLVPEFIQDAATPQALGAALLRYFDEPETAERLHSRFAGLHDLLRRQADEQAAEGVLSMLGDRINTHENKGPASAS